MIEIFWYIYLGILGTALVGFLIQGKKTVAYVTDFLISIVTWLGLFGYVTGTDLFTPFIWKMVFVGGLTWDITFTFVKGIKHEELEELSTPVQAALFIGTGIITVGPLYYGLFQYAF
ncbi:hypothetical protein ACR3I8_16920 [Priestia flexa]|uniref:hypothetical protein n=1 Tax=Priestia flexa TaxID=86664 RepID=UPI0028906841|nr:hypothetical protein [Priestia flexa]MDT2048374.1 hypothetical protein [Priestia flexa]